jgi:hypothetical protein
MTVSDRNLVPQLREHIQSYGERLNCLHEVDQLTDFHAIRLIQQREGYSPCFGRDESCKSLDCFWLEACANYRNPSITPLDKEFPNHDHNLFNSFQSSIQKLNEDKKGRLSSGEVGLKIRSYRNIPAATRKMLVAAPKTVVCENPEDAPLKPYILSHSTDVQYSYPNGIFTSTVEVFFTADIKALVTWLADTKTFREAGNLSYYPLMQRVSDTRVITPKASPVKYTENRIPVLGLSSSLNFGDIFSAPHLGLADGDIMVSDRSFSPILNLDLPVLENIGLRTSL